MKLTRFIRSINEAEIDDQTLLTRLGLSVRALNACLHSGLYTLGDLRRHGVRKMPNMGRITMEELLRVMQNPPDEAEQAERRRQQALGRNPERNARIVQLRKEGLTLKAISDQVGVGTEAIRLALVRYEMMSKDDTASVETLQKWYPPRIEPQPGQGPFCIIRGGKRSPSYSSYSTADLYYMGPSEWASMDGTSEWTRDRVRARPFATTQEAEQVRDRMVQHHLGLLRIEPISGRADVAEGSLISDRTT